MAKNYIGCGHSTYCIMTGYYDYVLGLIPLTLLGLTAILFVAGFGLTTAVPVGAGVTPDALGEVFHFTNHLLALFLAVLATAGIAKGDE